MWFDDFCLNIDATGTAYAYDDKTGNLLSASDNAQNKKIYDYDESSNELVGVTDEALSESYSYTYDTSNKHRLVAAILVIVLVFAMLASLILPYMAML